MGGRVSRTPVSEIDDITRRRTVLESYSRYSIWNYMVIKCVCTYLFLSSLSFSLNCSEKEAFASFSRSTQSYFLLPSA